MKKRIISLLLVILTLVTMIPMAAFAAPATSISNETTIYNFLKNELGLNTAAACGILANIYRESTFNPTAYNPKDNGNTVSYGICQWNSGVNAGNRYGLLQTWCSNNGYSYSSLTGQLMYMKHELETDTYYKYSYFKNSIPNTVDGAYDAAYIWAKWFEGCVESDYQIRLNYATNTFWPAYADASALTPGKPVLKNMKSTYASDEAVRFDWDDTANTTGYWLTVEKVIDGKYTPIYDAYADSGFYYTSMPVGRYCVAVTAKNSNTGYATESDWYYFEVVGATPGKPKVMVGKSEYDDTETITFTWASTENTDYYNLYLRKRTAEGDYNSYSVANNVTSGWSTKLPAGIYEAFVEACSYSTSVTSTGAVRYFTVYDSTPDKPEITGLKSYYDDVVVVNFSWSDVNNTTEYYLVMEKKNQSSVYEEWYTESFDSPEDFGIVLPSGEYRVSVTAINGNATDENGNYISTRSDYYYFTFVDPVPGKPVMNDFKYQYTTEDKVWLEWEDTVNTTYYAVSIYKIIDDSYVFITSKEVENGFYLDFKSFGTGKHCLKLIAHNDEYSTESYYYFDIVNPAKITTQPKSVTVADGEKATVSVGATGDGLTYEWYYKQGSMENFEYTSAFTGNTYSVTMSSDRSGCQIYCVVTDKYGYFDVTDIVTLGMKNYAKITTQPKSVTVAEGQKATVKFTATGDGLKYYWYFKNPGASKFTYTSSFTGNTYSVALAKERSGRQVYCYVVDKYGNSIKSNTVTLTVGNTAKITTQPKNASAADGASARTTVYATGDGLTYTWYAKDVGDSKFYKSTAYKTATYSVVMTAARNGRQVYCVVTDKYGKSVTTDVVTLSMRNNAKITSQPKSVTVAAGAKATVKVTATGDGLKYYWYFKNPGASKFTYTSSFTGNTYSVALAKERSGRQVYCYVVDKYGNSVKSNTVTLSVGNVAKITTQPKNASAADGASARTTVYATGDGLTYTWYAKDVGDSKFYKSTAYKTATYSVVMTAARNGRQVYCVVTDKYGNSVTTNTVTLSIRNNVKITSQPTSVTVAAGAKATVKVGATGDGLTYKWYFKNPGATKFSYTSTFTGNTYSVALAAARNGRQVYCVITDKYGNSVTTNTVTLKTK